MLHPSYHRLRGFSILLGLFATVLPGVGLRADITGFGAAGSNFSLNSGATVSNGVATLTDGNITEARSIFYKTPQAIAGFDVSFTYHESATVVAAGEGITFVVQDDTRKSTAVGQSGTYLGYGGSTAVSPSAAVQFNLVNGAGVTASNTGFATNGALTGSINNLSAGANLGNGDNIQVNLVYNGNTLTETLTDLATGYTSPTYSYAAGNLAAELGSSTAYIGFTGSTGALAATQTISNFSYVAVPESAAWGPGVAGSLLLLAMVRLRRTRRPCRG